MTVGSMVARGIILLILGILLVIFTIAGMYTLTILGGIFLIVYGITAIAGGASFDSNGGRALGIVFGILVIILGILALANPTVFANVATIFIAAAAFVGGICELIAGIVGGNSGVLRVSRPLQIILGIVGILFGALVFCWPFFVEDLFVAIFGPALGLTWLFGAFAIIVGVILIIEAIVVHNKNKKAAAKTIN